MTEYQAIDNGQGQTSGMHLQQPNVPTSSPTVYVINLIHVMAMIGVRSLPLGEVDHGQWLKVSLGTLQTVMNRYLGNRLHKGSWFAASIAAVCILAAIQVFDSPSSLLWKYPLWVGITASILASIFLFIDLARDKSQPMEDGRSERLAYECESLAADISEFMAERKAGRPASTPDRKATRIKQDETYETYKKNIDYSRITSNMYERRFSFRIHHLVDELKGLGHSPDELLAFSSNPLSDKKIEILISYAHQLREGRLIKDVPSNEKIQKMLDCKT